MTLSTNNYYYKNDCIFPVNCIFYLNSSLNGTALPALPALQPLTPLLI